eukprot:202176_1
MADASEQITLTSEEKQQLVELQQYIEKNKEEIIENAKKKKEKEENKIICGAICICMIPTYVMLLVVSIIAATTEVDSSEDVWDMFWSGFMACVLLWGLCHCIVWCIEMGNDNSAMGLAVLDLFNPCLVCLCLVPSAKNCCD